MRNARFKGDKSSHNAADRQAGHDTQNIYDHIRHFNDTPPIRFLFYPQRSVRETPAGHQSDTPHRPA